MQSSPALCLDRVNSPCPLWGFTFVIASFQVHGARGCIVQQGLQAAGASVLARQVDCSLAVAVQGHRTGSSCHQEPDHIRQCGDHSQVKRSLGNSDREGSEPFCACTSGFLSLLMEASDISPSSRVGDPCDYLKTQKVYLDRTFFGRGRCEINRVSGSPC